MKDKGGLEAKRMGGLEGKERGFWNSNVLEGRILEGRKRGILEGMRRGTGRIKGGGFWKVG